MKPAVRSPLRAVFSLVAVVALTSAATAASTVTSLTATAASGVVTVRGTATFGPQVPVGIGTDPAGDTTVAAAGGPLAADLVGASISQAPFGGPIRFAWRVTGPVATAIPEISYAWAFQTNLDEPGSDIGWEVRVWPINSHFNAGGAEGRLYRCTGASCTELATQVVPSFDAVTGTATATFSPFDLGLGDGGGSVHPWFRVSRQAVFTAAVTTGTLLDQMTHQPHDLPSASVRVGVGDTGVEPTAAATLGSDGSFTADVPVSGSGAHAVVAEACFAGDCGRATTQVAV